jgi:uncharacterized damage-inducible protein DinB
MRRNSICFLGLIVVSLGLSTPGWAQDKPTAPPAAPTSGARAEFLDRLDFYEQRFVSLAQAVPAEKYAWRPSEGVRSLGEVYLHVAAANYSLPRLIGAQPPPGIDVPGLEKSTTDKAKIIQTMKDSFAHYRSAVLGLSDADVEKTVKLFGKEHTYRYVFLFCTGHWGEHLGQSIAYARSNGIVPPWTEEQQQQQKQAQKPKS